MPDCTPPWRTRRDRSGARGPTLQGDAALACDSRGPHPLIAGAVGMIDYQEGDTLDFGRRGEADDGLAVAIGTEAPGLPGFLRHLGIRGGDFQHAFVVLR